ncbi:MAG: ABC transporter permease [Ardenticatenaceae bacterium]|nr:ABC transporter permease [Ardenticatenaceae bacterium]
MFRKIFALAWKDTIIRFSSRSELLFFLILPVVFTVLLSGGVGEDQNSDNRIPLLVVNEDDSELASTLVDALAASDVVGINQQPRSEAELLFADEAAPALLVIPAGFGAAVVAGETAVLDLRQLPNNSNASAADRAVQTAVSQVSQPWAAARTSVAEAGRLEPFADAAARQAYFQQAAALAKSQLAAAPERVTITQPETALTNANADAFDQAAHQSAGQLITWVFIPLLGTSALMAFERRYGTLRRLLVTPTGQSTYLLGTVTGQFATAVVQMALLIGFSILVLHVSWGQSPAGLVMVLLTFALASVALGVMLGTFVKTEGQASNLSIMLGMSMALLGGCWFPIELFPPAVQTAVHVLPTTWAMQGLSDLVLRGADVAQILPETAVLTAFAILFFVVGSLRKFQP